MLIQNDMIIGMWHKWAAPFIADPRLHMSLAAAGGPHAGNMVTISKHDSTLGLDETSSFIDFVECHFTISWPGGSELVTYPLPDPVLGQVISEQGGSVLFIDNEFPGIRSVVRVRCSSFNTETEAWGNDALIHWQLNGSVDAFYRDGLQIKRATSGGLYTITHGCFIDCDRVWMAHGPEMPSTDADGNVFALTGRLVYHDDFTDGNRSAWADSGETPYVRPDVGAAGGWGLSTRQTTLPGPNYRGGAGIQRTFTAVKPVITKPPIFCCQGNNPGPGGNNPGPVNPPVSTFWSPQCAGGGDVPTAPDLVDSESYV